MESYAPVYDSELSRHNLYQSPDWVVKARCSQEVLPRLKNGRPQETTIRPRKKTSLS